MLPARLRRVPAVLLAAALCAVAASTAQAQNAPAAQRVFDRARAASGGPGWNRVLGWHETGVDGDVRYERWVDPIRYGLRTETRGPAGRLVRGYNGAGEWRILANGQATGSIAQPVLAEVRAEAFFGAYAYFYPSRFDLRSVHLGVRQSGGRAFDVLRVQPAGGAPRELWFDRKTGLLSLMVEGAGVQRLTVELSDYRRAGPVLVPYRAVAYGTGLSRPKERRVESLDFLPADRSIFSLPRRDARARPAPAFDAARAAVPAADAPPSQPERKLAY
ncbi:hypothetical protein [Phenylobacterium sp.]|uniref:hypothetical protein n=1 Tax=Phenylobacterium sp. TaxID=1871053 RepID=UPI002F3E78D2